MTEQDRYLWDGSGVPDPMVSRLESILSPLEHDGRPLQGTESAPRRRWPRWVAAAAVAVVVCGFAWDQIWQPEPLEQLVLIIREDDQIVARLSVDDVYEVRNNEQVMELTDRCEITAAPGTRLRIERLDVLTTRLNLFVGSVEVFVYGGMPERFFQIRTPSTLCVDLGCQYTLTVDAVGNMDVDVVLGKVALENSGVVAFVPAGACCESTMVEGVGAPYFKDSTPPAVVTEIRKLNRSQSAAARLQLVGTILKGLGADPQNSLLAWHLLQDPSAGVVVACRAWLIRTYGAPPGLADTADPARQRDLFREHLEGGW